MLSWLTANIGTVLITLALIAIVTGVIVKLRRDRKKGRTSCGCGCEHCAMRGACHQKQ
jgi:hypothetical protein